MWFGYKKTDVDQTTVVCKVCRLPVPTTDSNTTNLFYHLCKNHEKEYRESQRAKTAKAASSGDVSAQNKLQTQTLQQAFTRGTPYSHSSRRWKEITSAVAKHISKDMVPIYTVEKHGFCELVQTLDPRYEMPSRKHITKVVLPDLYDACRERSVKLREVERAVGVCKKIVAAFSNSWKRRRELAKAQADQNPPLPPHQLITETPMRWGSMQAMVERVIEQEKALSQILKHQDGDTELTTTIKEGILKYLNEKYDDQTTQDLLDIASLVDPRFKTTYIKQERVDYIKTRAAAELQKLVAEQTKAVPLSAPSVTAVGQDEQEEVPAKKKKKSLSSYFKTSAKPSQVAPHSSRESIEASIS
ncbi:hypothetical protein PO909_019985 [Leuciscus waleckii]